MRFVRIVVRQVAALAYLTVARVIWRWSVISGRSFWMLSAAQAYCC